MAKQKSKYQVTINPGVDPVLNPTSRPVTYTVNVHQLTQAIPAVVMREYRKTGVRGPWKPTATALADRFNDGNGVDVQYVGTSTMPVKEPNRRPGPNYQLQALASKLGYEKMQRTEGNELQLIDFIAREYERLKIKPRREIFQLYLAEIERPDNIYHDAIRDRKLPKPIMTSGRTRSLKPENQKEQMRMAI